MWLCAGMLRLSLVSARAGVNRECAPLASVGAPAAHERLAGRAAGRLHAPPDAHVVAPPDRDLPPPFPCRRQLTRTCAFSPRGSATSWLARANVLQESRQLAEELGRPEREAVVRAFLAAIEGMGMRRAMRATGVDRNVLQRLRTGAATDEKGVTIARMENYLARAKSAAVAA